MMKWHMLCKLAIVWPTKWCTTNLGFIKPVQDGSQNNSQRCINKRVVDICQKHLYPYSNERDIFLDRIITGDETWVHHYEPESKWQNMEWKHPQSPCKKKSKTQPSAGKLMLTVFWDSQGPVLEHYQERSSINGARYSEMLTDRLKPAIRSKRQGLLSKGVLLLHNNARPHTAAHTAETLWKLKFEIMAHPPYSPDLSLSWLLLVWSTQRGIKGPSIHLGPRSEGSSVSVARCSAGNLLFWWLYEACAMMDQVCWKERGLFWKMIVNVTFLFVL